MGNVIGLVNGALLVVGGAILLYYLRDRFEQVGADQRELREDIRQLRGEVRNDVGQPRGEFGQLRSEFAQLRSEVRDDIRQLRGDVFQIAMALGTVPRAGEAQ